MAPFPLTLSVMMPGITQCSGGGRRRDALFQKDVKIAITMETSPVAPQLTCSGRASGACAR